MTEYQYKPGDLVSDKRYRIEKRINSGGCSEIYLAVDTKRFNKECVVKNFVPLFNLLKDKNTNTFEDLIKRFKKEAEILIQINHPCIPKLLCFEENDSLIIQDYINGQNLYELSTKTENKLNDSEIYEILDKILLILQEIHSKNIYHRDISPKNIMREKETNIIFLIDFGFVKENRDNDVNNLNSMRGRYGTYESPDNLIQDDLHDLGATCCSLLSNDDPGTYEINSEENWFYGWKRQVSGQGIKINESLLNFLQNLVTSKYVSAEEAYEEFKKIENNPEKYNDIKLKKMQQKNSNIKQWKCVNTIKIEDIYAPISMAITPDNQYSNPKSFMRKHHIHGV